MASGKSTLGRALAARLPGRRFIDLDCETEAILGCSAAEAAAEGRFEAFRSAESEALRRVASCESAIVACGGGTPCYHDNMDIMLAAGTVVCLRASTDRLLKRIAEAPAGSRPLLAGLSGDALAAKVDELQAARAAAYSRAHAFFDSSFLDTVEELESSCRRFIAESGLTDNSKPQTEP